MIRLLLLFLLGVVLILAGYWLWEQKSARDEEKKEESMRSDILTILREYEIEWTGDMKKKWADRKDYPLNYSVPYALYEVPRFESGNVVMTVGEERIFTDDFNYELFVFHNPDFVSGDDMSDDLLLAVANNLIDQSAALQEGEEEGTVRLYVDFYDTEEKDYEMRNQTYTQVQESVGSTSVFEMTGEVISAWFYNMEPPEMGIEDAREYTEELITDLHARIESGEITMEEAGNMIKDDPVMKDIDPGLEGNAYAPFSILGDAQTFTDPELQKEIISLSEGELSPVLVGRDRSDDWYDAYFMVVLVEEKQDGLGGFDEWIAQARSQREVVVFK